MNIYLSGQRKRVQPNTCMEEGHLNLIDDEQKYFPEILVDDEMVGDGICSFLTPYFVVKLCEKNSLDT